MGTEDRDRVLWRRFNRRSTNSRNAIEICVLIAKANAKEVVLPESFEIVLSLFYFSFSFFLLLSSLLLGMMSPFVMKLSLRAISHSEQFAGSKRDI